MIVFVITSLLISSLAFIVFLYAQKQGYFDNIEDIKYQVFRNDEVSGTKEDSNAKV